MAQNENNGRAARYRCKCIKVEENDDFYIYSILVEYSDSTQKVLTVKTNSSSVVIDNSEKFRMLVNLLKDRGVFDELHDSPLTLVGFQTLVERNGELKILEALQEEQKSKNTTQNSKIEPSQFRFKRFDKSGLFDTYTIETLYSNGQKREFVVNANRGSVSVLNDGNMGMQLLRMIRDKGGFDYNTPHTIINIGTLVFRDGKLRTLDELQNVRQNPLVSNSSGKHYAISDIHGMLGSYMDALGSLKDNDSLIIIGDAADRGLYGIPILLDIMQRQGKNGKGPQVTYLLGNHDDAFIDFIEISNKYHLSITEIEDLIGELNLVDSLNSSKGLLENEANGQSLVTFPSSVIEKHREIVKNVSKKIEEQRKKTSILWQRGISKSEVDCLRIWFDCNGGRPTAYLYSKISKNIQEELYKFLVNSPVYLTKNIAGKKLIFTHAAPPNDISKNGNESMTYQQMRDSLGLWETIDFLQDRCGENKFREWKNAGYITICGHSPHSGKIVKNKEQGYIDIDAGCGHGSKLALYCIDDGKVKFLDEKEEPTRRSRK